MTTSTKLIPTSSQTVGPYFRIGLQYMLDRFAAAGAGTAGSVEIRGRVLDQDGVGVSDAMLEFWTPEGAETSPSSTQDRGGTSSGLLPRWNGKRRQLYRKDDKTRNGAAGRWKNAGASHACTGFHAGPASQSAIARVLRRRAWQRRRSCARGNPRRTPWYAHRSTGKPVRRARTGGTWYCRARMRPCFSSGRVAAFAQ